MQNKLKLISGLIVAILAIGCTDNINPKPSKNDNPYVRIEFTANQKQVNDCEREFSWKFLNELAAVIRPEENILISPYSIDLAFSMLLQGANGKTLDEIKSALCMENMSQEDIASYFQLMTQSLSKADKKVRFTSANSLWLQNGLDAKEGYTTVLNKYFDAPVYPLTTVQEINVWCSKNTNGMIPKLMDDLSGDEIFILINALYFEGKWSSKFNTDKVDVFTNATGNKVQVQYMKNTMEDTFYRSGENFEMISVSYGNGAFSMSLLKPIGTTAMELARTISPNDINVSDRNFYEVTIKMPKFSVDYSADNDIKAALGRLGVAEAFSLSADFSKMVDVPVYVSDVIHKTKIEVDESGTTAAAVTGIIGDAMAPAPLEPKDFILDSPFIYLIQETSTEAILFMGVLNEL